MSQLDDLIKNYPFKCQKCEAEFAPVSLLASIITFGVVLLFGEKDGFIGWSCPGCIGQKINFKRLPGQNMHQLITAIRSILENGNLGRLCYHSFPYRYALANGNFHRRFNMPIDDDFQAMEEDDTIRPDGAFDSSGMYRSYEFGSAALRPAISVWWYDDAQVEKLIGLESKTGMTAFPRYIIHNRLYSIIENFCWRNRVHRNYFDDPNFPYDVKEVFLSDSKRRITKAYDFLTILDTVNSAELHQLSSSNTQIFISPQTVSSCLIDPANTPQKKISIGQHDNLSSQVWAAFQADWMQELLYNLAEDFISDYLSLIGRIDCNLQSIWALKESYLKTLFDAVSSRYKRDKAIEKTKASLRKRVLEAEKAFPDVRIISQDTKIADLKEYISQVAPRRIADSFLILGEPGTGKELFAKAVHQASKLEMKKFRKVSCGERSADLFASEIFGHVKGAFTGADRTVAGALAEANGGTVFFDEIGNLPLSIQPQLLRVLQDRKYVQLGTTIEKKFVGKFIFATNKNLDRMVEQDLFMPDLYDRFNAFRIPIPPLRSRKEDIPLLVEHFVRDYGDRDGQGFGSLKVAKDCIKYLKSLEWKGNIRTLENAIKETVARRIGTQDRSEITEEDLPDFITKSEGTRSLKSKMKKNLRGNMRYTEKDINDSLKETGGNLTHAAKMLGADRSTIFRRLKKLGLQNAISMV